MIIPLIGVAILGLAAGYLGRPKVDRALQRKRIPALDQFRPSVVEQVNGPRVEPTGPLAEPIGPDGLPEDRDRPPDRS